MKLQHQHKYVSISNLLISSIVRFCWSLSLLVIYLFIYIRFSYPSWIDLELTVFSLFLKDDLQKTWLCKRCETMSAKLRSVVPVAVISNMFCAISVALQLRWCGSDPLYCHSQCNFFYAKWYVCWQAFWWSLMKQEINYFFLLVLIFHITLWFIWTYNMIA